MSDEVLVNKIQRLKEQLEITLRDLTSKVTLLEEKNVTIKKQDKVIEEKNTTIKKRCRDARNRCEKATS
mgnify:CR=1 FL=1